MDKLLYQLMDQFLLHLKDQLLLHLMDASFSTSSWTLVILHLLDKLHFHLMEQFLLHPELGCFRHILEKQSDSRFENGMSVFKVAVVGWNGLVLSGDCLEL